MKPEQKEFYLQNKSKINALEKRFAGYHTTVSANKLKDFLNQFSLNHMNLGLRILDRVCYFSNAETTKQVRQMVSMLNNTIYLKNQMSIFVQ